VTLTDEVRSFNRFYTLKIGLLNRSLPATDLSPPEARVLYELAQAPEAGLTAAAIGRTLSMDKAHLSRIVARFHARRLAHFEVTPEHRKHRLLSLTDTGRKVFAAAEAAARAQVGRPAQTGRRWRTQSPRRGDARHSQDTERSRGRGRFALAAAPAGRRGLDHPSSDGALSSGILLGLDVRGACQPHPRGLIADFDASREDAWVAERAGAVVGSIFLMKSDCSMSSRKSVEWALGASWSTPASLAGVS
jgi:DNA-binding MarR family transcriptional regulator